MLPIALFFNLKVITFYVLQHFLRLLIYMELIVQRLVFEYLMYYMLDKMDIHLMMEL